ncbi:MAG TPA: hypothetical protein VHD32_07560 [Candidatus Didemnitutus sp.]|nr:hypothetical protein [Candidatus Didemnitutus sp.]
MYTRGGGRLGNQILRFVHWLAWAREHPEIEILNLSFWPYARFFSSWRSNPACLFPARESAADALASVVASLPAPLRGLVEKNIRLQRAVHQASALVPGWDRITLDEPAEESIDLDDPAFLARVRSRKVMVCSGWRIAAWTLVAKHQRALQPLFAPAEEFAAPVGDFVAKIRQRHDVVAGVLIRQTDYQHWAGGRFFYPARQYASWMRSVAAQFPDRRVAFVVASDAPQAPADFDGLDVHFSTGLAGREGHWFESFAALARCDFVLSVPSTFAACAAFVGNIPLWPLDRPPPALSVDQMIRDPLTGAAAHAVFSEAVK